MKVQEALNIGKENLKKNNIEDASLITRILLASILMCSREKLVIEYNEELKKEDEKEFFKYIEKIAKGYPMQYITNSQEFMKMCFYVDERVLIPRPDTEILVEEVIKICKEKNKKNILELCTGSGAIAISLAKYLENIEITATDISKEALEIAIKNKELLLTKTIEETKNSKQNQSAQYQDFVHFSNSKNRQNINFIQSDMFQNIDKKYDLIVSNPPYIKEKVIEQYSLKYEPRIALEGGEDGLKFYRTIINEGYKYLNSKGIIALEIGFDQKEDVINIAKSTGKYKNIYYLKDLGGNDRIVVLEANFRSE